FEARHSLDGFQRVLRAHQPPDIVKFELLERERARVNVTPVRRIERASEQPDPQAGRNRPRRPWPIYPCTESCHGLPLRPRLSGAAHDIFEDRQLLDADRTARV